MTFTVRGCRVTVSFLFLALATLLLLQDKSGLASAGMLAAALHESGHMAVMSVFRVKPLRIRFSPFGIDIVKSRCASRSYLRDALISFAGPATNFFLLLFLLLCGKPLSDPFAAANLALGGFNLLPLEPLDGGQALYSFLCIRHSADYSARTVSTVSFLVLTPLAAAGFLLLFRSPGNFSLLLVCGYLMALLLFKNGRYY